MLLQPQASFEIVDIRPALLEGGMIEYLLMQRNIGLDAFDHHLCKCVAHAGDGGIAGIAIGK